MLKHAHAQGYVDALATYGLEKYAAPPSFGPASVNPNVGVLSRTRAHAENLGSGLKGWLGEKQTQPATTARSRAGTVRPTGEGAGLRSRMGTGQAASRDLAKKQVMTSAKGLALPAAIGLGGLYAAKKIFGKKDKKREAMGLS